MKDQYFGDVNDYRKYGLLRAILAGAKVRLGICWMLTAPDSRRDGRHLGYLSKPKKFRPFDSELFDWLSEAMRKYPDRRVARIETAGLLGDTVYYPELLADGHHHRNAWFAECRRQFGRCDLVFFHPDNELERSIPLGRRHSHKFLYWREVGEMFSAGASVLVYQHFPRESRLSYTERLAKLLRAETGAHAIFTFSTPHVLFLLAAHKRNAESFRDLVCTLRLRWPEREIAGREILPSHSQV